jgi:hypothetical protein
MAGEVMGAGGFQTGSRNFFQSMEFLWKLALRNAA